MQATDPCSVCGGKDLNLVDGFYYCVECGTQDTNVRETVVEHTNILADGQIATVTKRKIVKIKDDKVQMSGEWYKWHTFNFILCGLADELIALGAKPTFKMKLLWIWSKYVKKYQKKDDLGLTVNNETGAPSILQNTIEDPSDVECDGEDVKISKTKGKRNKILPSRDIKNMTSGLLVAMLYVALNMDNSDIQITHLYKFIEEGRLITSNFNRHIPEDVDVKVIPGWGNFLKTCGSKTLMGIIKCRAVAMTLIRMLDLGSPVLPDMRKIVSNYVTELCLPDEFKNLVFSLMLLWPCDFLEIDKKSKVLKVPDYDIVAMTYVVVGLKMCFGLDDQYEYKLSDVVDRINKKGMYSKCYKLGFTPEPTGRMFSFREWINYLQFRRKMLTTLRLCQLGDEHYLDTNDYTFIEYLTERPKGKITLTDELSMNIINKIPMNEDIVVIPKTEFPHTLTPMTTYTEIISHHCKDSESIQLLSEDFKRYSLKFACESLDLSDLDDAKNIIVGVSDNNKFEKGRNIPCFNEKGLRINKIIKMIFIRNCDNKNWLKTKKPTIDHVTFESSNTDKVDDGKNDTESDHGYASNTENIPNDKDTSIDTNDSVELETIREEEEGRNIFNDAFEHLEISDETEAKDDNNFDALQEEIEANNKQSEIINQSDMEDNKSVSSTDSFEFHPETFNRERAIKELIMQACKKYKIPIPKEYRTTEPRKRKHEHLDDGQTPRKHVKKSEYVEAKQKVNKLLAAYYNYVEKDVINQVAREVKSVIWEMNQTKHFEVPIAMQDQTVENPQVPIQQVQESIENPQIATNSIVDNPNETKETTLSTEANSISKEECKVENREPILFEDSDGGEVDDLVPKSDAQFDEKNYDIDQLYIKMNATNFDDLCASMQDPQTDKILEKKIEEYDKGKKLKVTKVDDESSDTEDELPLRDIKEERDMCLKKMEEENNYEPLIASKRIQQFKYWVKHYDSVYMARAHNVAEKFDSEICKNTSRTFNFLLRECAAISGCRPFSLYRSLQYLEDRLVRCASDRVFRRKKNLG